MKNSFGSSVSLTLFGESHGPAIGCVLDGLAPGIPVDPAAISRRMSLRRSLSSLSTARQEEDRVEILSGVYGGKTTGTPIALLVRNENTRSEDYKKTEGIARPGHADLTAYYKYHGHADPRGGGHFSGRLTAPIVAAGSILLDALADRGVLIGTHLSRVAGIADRPFGEDLAADLSLLADKPFAVLSDEAGERMQAAIAEAKVAGDSVGGVLETAVLGLPLGVGEPFFDSLESRLAHALFSIPAVKGVEFGGGFSLAEMRGSAANDAIRAENGSIYTKTNHAGGILGGISNGMPLRIRTAIKPTPSIYLPQESVDLSRIENTELTVNGRHDPAIVHRARIVADSMVALVLADLLALRFGTDFLAE